MFGFSSLARAAPCAAALGLLMFSGALSAQEPAAVSAPTIVVDTVLVRGNTRLSEAAVRALSGIRSGTPIRGLEVQTAIRRLMASGNFESVEVLSADERADRVSLVLQVTERPFIADVSFRGLEHLDGKTVRDTVGFKTNEPLDPGKVLEVERMIRTLLAARGFRVASVDTALTPVTRPENAYRLTFRVREAGRLNVAAVEFQGNDAFGDESLRGEIKTKPEGFLWFRPGKFDRDVLREDLAQRLPDFYGSKGYVDFRVVSDTLLVDTETGKARLVVTVDEGPQYRLGSFVVEGNTAFPTEQLERMFTAQSRTVLGLPFGRAGERERGEVFDKQALDAAVGRIQRMYNNQGYLYAQVVPVVERVAADDGRGTPTVDVRLAVSERSPFYINTVSIAGNNFTHESVIRDRLAVFPGDVYSEERLLQSYQAIGALGFFETPLQTPDIVPNAETGTVDLVFHVKEKQTGNIGFGTALGGSRGGISGFLSFTQPNLFGQGKQADLRVEYGIGRNLFQASYTDPSIRGTRTSGTASLFHTDDRYRGFSGSVDGRSVRTGASLQAGFPFPGARGTRAFVGYSLSRHSFDTRQGDICDPNNAFCRPNVLSSAVSFSVARDTRNHPLFPTAGVRQSFGTIQTGGPLGGDGNSQKMTLEGTWWVPVANFGGSQPGSRPIRTAIGLQARTGSIFGDISNPFDRFFLGGTYRGEQLRGYDEFSITPTGFIDPAIQNISLLRLGNSFLTLTGEYAVRFNDNLSLSAFAEAGNIWNNPSSINPTQLFRGAGLGVTVVTPFGPLGLDYAYGFDRPDPGFKLHFKLGNAF